MGKNFTLYVRKIDRRTKHGTRPHITRVYTNQTPETMAALVEGMRFGFPESQYTIEYFPTTVTVKNLMTGQDVEIDRDTPWCCNPSSESYWSN